MNIFKVIGGWFKDFFTSHLAQVMSEQALGLATNAIPIVMQFMATGYDYTQVIKIAEAYGIGVLNKLANPTTDDVKAEVGKFVSQILIQKFNVKEVQANLAREMAYLEVKTNPKLSSGK